MKSINSHRIIHVDRYLNLENHLDLRQAKSDAGRRIDLLVDWDGVSDIGTLQVRNTDGCWETCGNLKPDTVNDVILTGIERTDAPFVVRIERGPDNGAREFEAWVYAITWKPNAVSQGVFTSDFDAILGTHYDYVDKVQHKVSSTLEGGIQVASLELASGCDWELWVRLRHPTENTWLLQDPVVRSGDRNGTPASSPDPVSPSGYRSGTPTISQ